MENNKKIDKLELVNFIGDYGLESRCRHFLIGMESQNIETFKDIENLRDNQLVRRGNLIKIGGCRKVFHPWRYVGLKMHQVVYSYFDSKGFELFKDGYQEKELHPDYFKKETK